MPTVVLREIEDGDREWLLHFMNEHWGGAQMVTSSGVHQLDQLPGVVAFDEGELVGLVSYQITGQDCEVVSLDSVREGQGIGTRLMAAVENLAAEADCQRVWMVTTNDNLNALKFYQKRGYELVRIHRGAVERARQIKPTIPMIGIDGIPIRDEIELEKRLLGAG